MATPDLRVAVVIATRNRASLLRESLARLLALPEQPRVIVVDNNSVDETRSVVAAVPGVRLVSLSENRGAAARNVGVRFVDAPYVAFADDDSWYAPEALGQAADLLDARARLGLIAARVLVGTDEVLDSTCATMAASTIPAPAGLPGPAILGFLACGAVVRRSAFVEVGGFTDRFGVGGEEQLLAIDLAAAGWELAYVADVTAYHCPPPRLDENRRRRLLIRNGLWCAWLRRRPVGVLRRTARLVRGSLCDPVLLAGVLDAVRLLPAILRDRRPVSPDLERMIRSTD